MNASSQNILNHEPHKLIVNVKELRNTKTYAHYLISFVLLAILGVSFGFSSLPNSTIIGSSGRIGIPISSDYTSEVRGVFIHESIFSYTHDWSLIASTLAQYKINAVYANFIGHATGFRPDNEWVTAISAFHSYGIEFHVSYNVMGDIASSEETKAEDHAGNKQNWNCPIKAKNLIVQTVTTAVSNYDIDGIMLDYIRYRDADQCYCNQCRAEFEEWLGEGTITDWTPFYPSHSRWDEYANWRNEPVSELVKIIHDTAKTIKPNIVISEAAWPLFSGSAIYWRKWIGQDTAYWIKEGYIDFVAPMMYTKVVSGPGADTLESYIDASLTYWMGGQTEGKIPLIAFLRTDWPTTDMTPTEFKAQVDYVRSRGLDGWIIWRYGGPGSSEPNPDIRNYLSVIDLPNTFSIRNIQVLVNNETSTTITWFTDLPATSKIEYSTNSLFNASWETQSGFHYWNITRIQSIIVENASLVTEHSVTLAGLMPGTVYYFRVQSQRASDIATSKVMTFTTSG